MNKALNNLNNRIIQCRACTRLVQHREKIAGEKVRRFQDHRYWGKPVPGFGDPGARVLVIGLAPAAHGANRTGRMFTGDSSGDWLYKALFVTGFANQQQAYARDDGLELSGIYITAIVRCVPPGNKPTRSEISRCSEKFLEKEINLLGNVKVIICLGKLAFDRFCRIQKLKGFTFGHGRIYPLEYSKTLIVSYHPSRQNTNTGRLKWNVWLSIFQKARETILAK